MERLVLNSGRPLPLLPNWSLDGRVDNVAIARDGGATAARAWRPLLLPSGRHARQPSLECRTQRRLATSYPCAWSIRQGARASMSRVRP